MSGYRPSYTHEEEKRIVDYIVENNEYDRVKGDKLWKIMEENLMTDRTWQSLKQHFRKKIIQHLHYPHYELSIAEQSKIRNSFYQTRSRSPQPLPPAKKHSACRVQTVAGATSQERTKQPKFFIDEENGRKIPNLLATSSSSSDSE